MRASGGASFLERWGGRVVDLGGLSYLLLLAYFLSHSLTTAYSLLLACLLATFSIKKKILHFETVEHALDRYERGG